MRVLSFKDPSFCPLISCLEADGSRLSVSLCSAWEYALQDFGSSSDFDGVALVCHNA